MIPPQVLAEHDDVRAAGQFVCSDDSASKNRTQPEESGRLTRDLGAHQLLRVADAAEHLAASADRTDRLEDVASAIAPVCKLRKREDAIVASVIDVDVEQLHERSLVRIRQRSQEHGVHDAEDCGRRAHAKPDRQGHDRRKAGSLPDGPTRVPEVLKYRHTDLGRDSSGAVS
jgi:hypothetical protein